MEPFTGPPFYKASPFACIVLSENSNHPLHRAQYGPMDDDGSSSVVSILPVTCHISWFYGEQPNRLLSLHTDAEHLPIFSLCKIPHLSKTRVSGTPSTLGHGVHKGIHL